MVGTGRWHTLSRQAARNSEGSSAGPSRPVSTAVLQPCRVGVLRSIGSAPREPPSACRRAVRRQAWKLSSQSRSCGTRSHLLMNLPEKSFASGASGLLDAVRVVDMSRLVSGHMFRPQLANLGAEVINEAPRLSVTLGRPHRPAPALGDHTAKIIGILGSARTRSVGSFVWEKRRER
jgi:hypothetical protein